MCDRKHRRIAMPLRMKIEGKVDKPIFVCDHCGEEIDSNRAGHFSWRYDLDGTPKGDVYFTHQACSAAFTQQKGGPNWCSKDLECLPVYLLQRLGISWSDAEKKVQWLDSQPD
jgi:hypothetical protein